MGCPLNNSNAEYILKKKHTQQAIKMGSLASEGRKETAYKRGWDGKIQGKKE